MTKKLPPVFFEMLQSFIALATNLNLSKAVKELGVTRQTIRRHITELEYLTGKKYLVLNERVFVLTPDGEQALGAARILTSKAQQWLDDGNSYTKGLNCANVVLESGIPFYAQRHPLAKLWNWAPPLLQQGLHAWTNAECQIEHEAVKIIRPYLVIYRRHRTEWICAEMGERSSYATWLGLDWAKSAVGASFGDDPISSAADSFMIEAYETVSRTGGVWYDHVSTKFPREANGEACAVNYQRLVLSFIYPNGDPAIAALVARTNNVQLDGVNPKYISQMCESDLMEFDL